MTVAYISKTLSLLWRQKINSAGRIKWLAFPVRCSFIYNKPRTLQHHDIEHDKTTQSCFFTFLSVMEIIFFKLTLKSHESKMFIKANTLWTQSQIKLHKTNNFYLKFKCNHLRQGQFPLHLYSCNMAWVTSEQHCLLPSPVITEGQTTSTSIMHAFTVDQLPYSTHSLHLKVEHLILREFVTFSYMLVSILKRDIFWQLSQYFDIRWMD